MRYRLTPARMATIKKSTNNKSWRGREEKETLLHCWWECKLVQPLRRTVWRFLKKLEIELPYDSAMLLLGVHTKEMRIERDTCTSVFTATLFTTEKIWKQLKCLVMLSMARSQPVVTKTAQHSNAAAAAKSLQ